MIMRVLPLILCLLMVTACVADPDVYPFNDATADTPVDAMEDREKGLEEQTEDTPSDVTPDEVLDTQADDTEDLPSGPRPMGVLTCDDDDDCTCPAGSVCVCPAGAKCDKTICEGEGCALVCTDSEKCKLKCEESQTCELTCGEQDDKECKLDKCERETSCAGGVSVCNGSCPVPL